MDTHHGPTEELVQTIRAARAKAYAELGERLAAKGINRPEEIKDEEDQRLRRAVLVIDLFLPALNELALD